MASAAGVGSAKRYPWMQSHPNASRVARWSASSTPSAIEVSPRALVTSMTLHECRAFAVHGESLDECFVDLDDVDRQIAQSVERRIAGAVVVDRESQSEVFEGVEPGQSSVGVGHQGALGDLQDQCVRGQPRVGKCTGDVVDQGRTTSTFIVSGRKSSAQGPERCRRARMRLLVVAVIGRETRRIRRDIAPNEAGWARNMPAQA